MVRTMIARARARARSAVESFIDDDAGDVPGWVLITLMTAGLVALIWTFAGPALERLFNEAISRVAGI